MSQRTFVVRKPDEDSLQEVLDFHRQHLTKHLFPRTLSDLQAFHDNNSLYELMERPDIGKSSRVGLCYVAVPEDPQPGVRSTEPHEFGGVFLVIAVRQLRLADHFGMLAIANSFGHDPPPSGVEFIAHVHEFNPYPRKLLERLGFTWDGVRIDPLPKERIADSGMETNEEGQVVGHVFEFHRSKLTEFADTIEKELHRDPAHPWIEMATPHRYDVRVDLPQFQEDPQEPPEDSPLRGLIASLRISAAIR